MPGHQAAALNLNPSTCRSSPIIYKTSSEKFRDGCYIIFIIKKCGHILVPYHLMARIKYSPPRRPAAVFPRQHLHQQNKLPFDSGSVLLAKATFDLGRTTLAASFLKTEERLAIWYQPDRSDAYAPYLFRHMRLSLRKFATTTSLPVTSISPVTCAKKQEPAIGHKKYDIHNHYPATVCGIIEYFSPSGMCYRITSQNTNREFDDNGLPVVDTPCKESGLMTIGPGKAAAPVSSEYNSPMTGT